MAIRYLRHIAACNSFDPARFLAFRLDGVQLGFVRRAAADALKIYPGLFSVDDRSVDLQRCGRDAAALSAALLDIAPDLAARKLVGGVRGEPFAIAEQWGGAVLFDLDRGLVPFFGTRSYGVHVNGIVAGAAVPTLWIGKRAADKKIAPGKLDNIVAGGIASGYGAFETLIKEAAEEADIGVDLASQAISVSAITYRMELPDGMRNDTLFVYDLEVPPGFAPRNTDGEIEDFRQMTVAECLDRVARTDDFKFNVNLVLIDFAIRHGMIKPDDTGFVDLATGLRRDWSRPNKATG